MDPLPVKKIRKPESILQDKIENMLTLKGWFVKSTHGSVYQHGFPDCYATHSRYGARWVEVKILESYSFTNSQIENFPKFVANGSGIWILVADTEEEYQKLFQPCNWWQYLGVMANYRRTGG